MTTVRASVFGSGYPSIHEALWVGAQCGASSAFVVFHVHPGPYKNKVSFLCGFLPAAHALQRRQKTGSLSE